MKRRSWLLLCGGTLTALAGCGGSASDPTATNDRRSSSPTTTDGPADPVTITSVSAPQTAELGARYAVVVEFENPTDREQSLTTPVSIQVDDQWQQYTTIDAAVPPGRTTADRSFVAPPFLGSYRMRIEEQEVEWGIETTTRTLTFGDTFTTPRGLRIGVLGGQFADTYASAGNQTITPSTDQQFVIAVAQVGNPTEQPIEAPPLGAFHVQGDTDRYPVSLSDPTQRLAIEPGTTQRIQLPFEVPQAFTEAQLVIRWSATYQQGRSVVRWQSPDD